MSGTISATTLSYIALAATVASATVSAYTAYSSGENAKEIADYNAGVAELDARSEKDRATYEETVHRERVRKLISSQRALYGKSGVDMTGSPLLAIEDTAGQGELDALVIRHGGDVQAAQQRSSANLLRMEGKNARTAGYLKAGSTLLSGAGSAYGQYSKIK